MTPLKPAAIALLLSSSFALAAPLGPNSGAMTVAGSANDHDGNRGAFSIHGVLKAGNFTGSGHLAVGKTVVDGALDPKQSYLENGKCYFRWEAGKAHAGISGTCDGTTLTAGRMESFTPDDGSKNGEAEGKVSLETGAAPAPSASAGRLPTAKLTCAFTDRRIGVAAGQTTQYSLGISNMASLTLSPAGTYRTANGGGKFSRSADKIRLAGGPFDGAIGTLEADRSGVAAVVFHIEENRRPNGVHIVDPYTTRCTASR
jgi:hypothetical protein